LELFYKDANRWAYTFQMYAFLSRLKAQMNAAKDDPAGV
jgi:deoxyadenosine/deoxycytidine kinase